MLLSGVALMPWGEQTMSPLSNCVSLSHIHTLKGFLSHSCVSLLTATHCKPAKQADIALMNPQVKPQARDVASKI